MEMETPVENKNGILSLLPIEMWEAVLDCLDDSKDVQNFCKAWEFPDFYAILHKTKQSWLIDQVFPLIFPYISSKSQVLGCRLVCRRWRNGVDNFLESNPSRRPVYNMDPVANTRRFGIQPEILRNIGLLYTSLSLERIQKFLQIPDETFPITTKNPIVGRSVNFGTPIPPALEFLRKVGHHIWDFSLEINKKCPLELLNSLQPYLECLPNLKRLRICAVYPRPRSSWSGINGYYDNTQVLNLPRLPSLETLELTILNPNHNQCLMETFLKNYQVKRLVLDMHGCWIPTSVKFDQLTELTISIDWSTQLEVLGKQDFNQLERLTVLIRQRLGEGSSYGGGGGGHPDFSTVFHLLNDLSCAKNLVFLSIEFPKTFTATQWNSQGPLPILELPNLKTLELKEGKFYSFNFICQLANLEYLHLHQDNGSFLISESTYDDQNTPEEREILDPKHLLDNPASLTVESVYRSNLWKILPRLKHFTVSKTRNYGNLGWPVGMPVAILGRPVAILGRPVPILGRPTHSDNVEESFRSNFVVK